MRKAWPFSSASSNFGIIFNPCAGRVWRRRRKQRRPWPAEPNAKLMLDAIYIGLAVVTFAAFVLYALGCDKL